MRMIAAIASQRRYRRMLPPDLKSVGGSYVADPNFDENDLSTDAKTWHQRAHTAMLNVRSRSSDNSGDLNLSTGRSYHVGRRTNLDTMAMAHWLRLTGDGAIAVEAKRNLDLVMGAVDSEGYADDHGNKYMPRFRNSAITYMDGETGSTGLSDEKEMVLEDYTSASTVATLTRMVYENEGIITGINAGDSDRGLQYLKDFWRRRFGWNKDAQQVDTTPKAPNVDEKPLMHILFMLARTAWHIYKVDGDAIWKTHFDTVVAGIKKGVGERVGNTSQILWWHSYDGANPHLSYPQMVQESNYCRYTLASWQELDNEGALPGAFVFSKAVNSVVDNIFKNTSSSNDVIQEDLLGNRKNESLITSTFKRFSDGTTQTADASKDGRTIANKSFTSWFDDFFPVGPDYAFWRTHAGNKWSSAHNQAREYMGVPVGMLSYHV